MPRTHNRKCCQQNSDESFLSENRPCVCSNGLLLVEGEQRTPQPEDVEEGEVVEIVTTTGDVHVVEEQSPHFTSDSAHRLIQDIMFCSQDLDIIKQKTNDIEQKLKNMIDVLGRI
ncbi:hypothetical protein AB205_0106360 [Aquarana catesbeiana]|uniref:Uncharacterized protein n=1 Tax=Aquarana catesbeiana TaxID=8400 RepID=A0A2G9R3G6_AQUCT|nr:hypothetical protein AB205_0106360 [Aquarana catesbeiana]